MQVTDIRTVTQPIDGSKVPGFFSRYPAALSVDAANVQRTLLEVGEKASEPGSRERRRALVRHSNPHGDPFSICHCSADPEKLALLASIVEVFWIHDGILLPPIEWLDRHISNSLQDMAEELDHNAVRQPVICMMHLTLTSQRPAKNMLLLLKCSEPILTPKPLTLRILDKVH